MPVRLLLPLFLVLCCLARFAFCQNDPSRPGTQPGRQIEVETVLLRLTGTGSNLEEIKGIIEELSNLSDGREYASRLEGLRGRSQVTVLATPRLAMLVGHPARFFSGDENDGFGTALNGRATQMDDGRIVLELDISHSEKSGEGEKGLDGKLVYGRSTDAVHTSIVLQDGQAFAIPGSGVRHEVREVRKELPILKDIPLLRDVFFKRESLEVEVQTFLLGRLRVSAKQ